MRVEAINLTHLIGIKKVYQKNKLKDLIYIQENKACNEQTVKGLFRSIVEPILNEEFETIVLFRLEEKSKKDFNSLLKRLEFSKAKVYDFSDTPFAGNFSNILKEKIWDKTEFVYVLSGRFGAVFIFDYEESNIKDFAQIYMLYNSKDLFNAFEIINSNSKIDLSEYPERLRPDRRENETLNKSIRQIVENLNETNQELLISEKEKETAQESTNLSANLNFVLTKSSHIAHEMRNLFSICNLYSEIIEKQTHKVQFLDKESEKSISNARECIKKSLQMAGNLLLDLKSMQKSELKEHNLNDLLNTAINLAQIYANGKDIRFNKEIKANTNILADEYKLKAVIINLIKNAIEGIDEKGEIVINTKSSENEKVKIIISNTGNPISKEVQERIFEEGFTTKATGSGLGLVICKKTLEEQSAQLKLLKSDDISTEFEITLLKGGM